MSIPYHQSVHQHPGSRMSPEYELMWSETPMQPHSKATPHPPTEYQGYNQSSEFDFSYLQTPANQSSSAFSPVSPLYASVNHMLATPSTTFDAMEQFPTPELFMRPDFAKVRNPSVCEGLNAYDGAHNMPFPEGHSQNNLLSGTYETQFYGHNYAQHNTSSPAPFSGHGEAIESQPHVPVVNAGSNRNYHKNPANLTPSVHLYSRRTVSAENTRQIPLDRVVVDSIDDGSPLLMGTSSLVQNTNFSSEISGQTMFDDLIADDPFININEDESWRFVRADGNDEEISQLLELEESRPRNEKVRQELKMMVDTNITSFSSPAKKSSRSPASTILGESPKSRRSQNSLNYNYSDNGNSAGPMFSLEDCSNEFRVSEGNFAFQDETAEVLKRLSITSLQKRRSISKTTKASTKPPLRKTKTAPNLGRQLSKNSIKMLKNMESGLLSFQLPQKK